MRDTIFITVDDDYLEHLPKDSFSPIEQDVVFNFLPNSKNIELSLSNMHFKGTVRFFANVENFIEPTPDNNIFLNNITFDKEIIIQNLNLNVISIDKLKYEKLIIRDCRLQNFYGHSFNSEEINSNITFDTVTFFNKIIFNTAILENVNFSNSVFKKGVNFKKSTLTDCNFHRTEFHEKADFRHSILENNTFAYTEFREQGAFYGATFVDNPKFNNLILGDKAHLYFENLNPNNTDLSIEKFSLINTVINGRIDFSENIIACIDFKDSTIIGTLTRTNFHPKCANWQTATLLKNEEIKCNNIIQALTYKAEEKELYEDELWTSISSKSCLKKLLLFIVIIIPILLLSPLLIPLYIIKCIVSKKVISKEKDSNENKTTDTSTMQLVFEYLSLWIGKVSNNHGQSWGQGMIFTLIVWVVCFGMFYLPFPFQEFNGVCYLTILWKTITTKEFYQGLIDYLNPTKYDCLKSYFDGSYSIWLRIPKFFGVFWYLLGKALVPYGIYEVVKAFRKYDRI